MSSKSNHVELPRISIMKIIRTSSKVKDKIP